MVTSRKIPAAVSRPTSSKASPWAAAGRQLWAVASPGIVGRRPRASATGNVVRKRVRPVHRRDARESSPAARAARAHRQRIAAGADAALARRRHRDAARRQRVWREATTRRSTGTASCCPPNMDGVPGLELPRHPPRRDAYLSLPRQAVRHLLVPQPFRLPGTASGSTARSSSIRVEPEPFAYDRDHVVLLSDWTDEDPDARVREAEEAVATTTTSTSAPSATSCATCARRACDATLADRADVGRDAHDARPIWRTSTAHTYTYLMNGTHRPATGPGLFRPARTVRLRFINGSAMTYFDVRIPGLKMTVVAADGQYVHPVTVDEFRIAAAETFDVIVEPSGQDAFTIFAQAMDRTGYRSGTLAVRDGLRAPVPAAGSAADADDGRHGPWRHGTWHGMPAPTWRGMDHGMAGTDMSRDRRHATTRWPRMRHRPAEHGQSAASTCRRSIADAAARRSGHRPARQRPHGAHLRRSQQRVRRSGRPRARPRRSNCTSPGTWSTSPGRSTA